MGAYLLAHDLGTTGNKASLFSVEGKLVCSEVYSYQTYYFNSNWVEQDARDWWEAVCSSTKSLIKKAQIKPEEIKAVSFSGQMMGCLCVDRRGVPLRRSIIWADQRAQREAARIEEKISKEEYYRISGHRNTASYGVQKLMWIKEHEPETYQNTYKVLNAKDYIVFRLTGSFYTDYSDGGGHGCFDLKRLEWSEQIIAAAGVDIEKYPELKPSSYLAGAVTKQAGELTGLAEGTPVVLGAGDGVTTNVGAGSIVPGKTFCSMGTSAWIATTSQQPLYDGEMRTITWPHMIPGLYAPNGTMQYAGGAYHWIKNELCGVECQKALEENASPYFYLNKEVEKSPAGANGIIFLPYMLGERAPRWNPYAKGCFLGIKPENTRADMLRSVLEGVTMNLSIILDILRKQQEIQEILVLGGGAKGKIWRQIMADIWNADIIVPDVLEEAGAMGAAVNAGVGAGIYQDYTAIDKFIHIQSVQKPNQEHLEKYGELKELFDEAYFALEKVFHKFN
jgi:xylulokinase